MDPKKTNKKKIINDPVHGFISISSETLYDLVSHPYFQRLRRIKQLGMTNLVYPGANHSRFQHALGAMHLMQMAIDVIRSKGHEITNYEEESALIAILLHDIGHGPFSHTLESSIIPNLSHEAMSAILIRRLNKFFEGKLLGAIEIFSDRYKKKYLHQLVAGQLDMDRMDYLKRDSFYTGVIEGAVGSDRIIKMLNVSGDELVVESKGIYSVEKFLIARRLMYWQVYYHKTVVSAEVLLTAVLKRARLLVSSGVGLFASPSLQFFLKNYDKLQGCKEFKDSLLFTEEVISNFVNLDDDDILSAIKVWATGDDKVLATLSKWFVERALFRVEFSEEPVGKEQVKAIKKEIAKQFDISSDEASFFVYSGEISNHAYRLEDEKIRVLYNNGELRDISDASDMLNLSVLTKTVKKYFICYPKDYYRIKY